MTINKIVGYVLLLVIKMTICTLLGKRGVTDEYIKKDRKSFGIQFIFNHCIILVFLCFHRTTEDRQGYKGIPYSYMSLVQSDVDGNLGAVGTKMSVVYGKQGIQDMDGTEFFDVEQAEEEKDILSLYDMLNKVCEYFDSNEKNKVTIKEMGLCYLPVIRDPAKLEFTGVPVWYLVYGEGVAANTGTAREAVTFDARTGEIYG